jgi:hypothetical protein
VATTISGIAREIGVEPEELAKWANEVGLKVSKRSTLTDSEKDRLLEHLYSVTHRLAAGWGHALVDVLRKIEQRLPPTPTIDPESERRFLLLRESLGPRGPIDEVNPVIAKDEFPKKKALLPATARWCEGALVDVTWVGVKPDQTYLVTVAQGGLTDHTPWPVEGDRFEPADFDQWEPLDQIVVHLSDELIAVGGPIGPWARRC